MMTGPILVRDLMKVGVATVPPDAALIDITRLMLEKDLEAVVVLNPEDGNALGYVSHDEITKAYSQHDGDLESLKILQASEFMQEGVPQVPPDIPLPAAVQIMRDLKVRTLFIMHHAGGIEYPAAVLTYAHILRFLAAKDESDLKDLGIKAARKAPLDVFIERRDEAKRRASKQ